MFQKPSFLTFKTYILFYIIVYAMEESANFVDYCHKERKKNAKERKNKLIPLKTNTNF